MLINKYTAQIEGIISGFDRIIIKGIFRRLNFTGGMLSFLLSQKILLKDFGEYVKTKAEEMKAKSYENVREMKRPIEYLWSSGIRKNEYARKIQDAERIKEGLICLISVVEPFYGYAIRKNREKKQIELIRQLRKCLHLYYYWEDPVFGFMGARIQTWFPYTCYIHINGREWLEKMMIKEGIRYIKKENCFTNISDYPKAQQLMKEQLEIDWPGKLEEYAVGINPLYKEFQQRSGLEYYWTIDQSEWATDIGFETKEELGAFYRPLVKEIISVYGAKDVMRFLGRKPHGNYKGEVTSHYGERPEGIRIKHGMRGNSIKIYDKQEKVLRIETTINNPNEYKMYRPKEGEKSKAGIYPVRKGIADIYRRARISENCNERYLEALSALTVEESFYKLIEPICKHTEYNNRRARPLRPWEEYDSKVLKIIGNGDFILNGFRNKDIREKLFAGLEDKDEIKKASAKVTRFLWLLRAHGLIKKIPKTHRYQITDSGRKVIAAVLKIYNISMNQLFKVA